MSRITALAFNKLIVSICLAVMPSVLLANKPSDSYLEINLADNFEIRWDIALRDLEMLVGLDSNIDGQITWGEVKRQQSEVFEKAISHLKISLDGIELQLQPAGLRVAEHSDGSYAVLKFSSDAMGRFTLMKVDYDFYFNVDNSHRGLITYNGNFGSGSYVVSATDPTLMIPEGGTNWFYLALTYIRVGARHIWANFDHLVFLVLLILPSVWRFEEKRLKYVPAVSLKPALVGVCWMVTCLTIAQGITLWQAIYGSIDLPNQWCKTTMAVLIVLSAVHHMYPVIRYWVVIAVLAVGLTLGFSCGDFLTSQGLPSSMLPITLLGFTIGVGLAQLAVVSILFPIAFWVRRTNAYDQFVFHGGSTLIVILGTIWVIERLSGSTIIEVPDSVQQFL